MRHELVLNFHRRDPFATRLDEILSAVHQSNVPNRVDNRNVTSTQPAILRKALCRPRVVVIRTGDPRPGTLQLTTRFAVPCHHGGGVGFDHTEVDTKHDATDSRTNLGLFFDWQLLLGAVQRAHCSDWRGFSHAPRLQNGQPDLFTISLAQRFGHRRTTTHDGAQRRCVAILQLGQHRHPDSGHAGADCDFFIHDVISDCLARQIGARHHQVGATCGCGMSQTPSVDVKHRHDRQYGVGFAHPERVSKHLGHRVQER